jgi:hypothetical protein
MNHEFRILLLPNEWVIFEEFNKSG